MDLILHLKRIVGKYFWLILILFIALPLYPASAQAAYTRLSERVTLKYPAIGAVPLLKELERQTRFNFLYNTPEIQGITIRNLDYKQETLGRVLADLDSKTNLVFALNNNMISVSSANKRAPKRVSPGRIAGKIVDDKGENLPGASIRIVELNKSVQSSVDGTYQFSAEPGTYTLEVRYISFQTKRISGVVVKEGGLTKLDIVLKAASNALKEVVVQSSYRRESIEGLYVQQKNSASMTDGISAEQIARTPDNNMGQVLKRVSGITTVDNRYVVVRGLSERYNQAMLDGIIIPSTDMNRRNFSFDVIPQELVSQVVVNKTATPDVSSEFAGGQVSINTLDIPQQNFTSITIGTGFNDRTTGKVFLHAGEMGKYDFLGYDDGTREFPKGVNTDTYKSNPAEQSKLFNNKSYQIREYKANPNQNYRFSIGRLYDLTEKKKFGFTGGVTYRNTQEINWIDNDRGFGTEAKANLAGEGHIYRFNTTLGAVLNGGLQGEKFKLTSRNYYSRLFNDNFYSTIRAFPENYQIINKENFQDPQYTTVYQNKLEGESAFGSKGLKLNWDGAVTNIRQGNEDSRRFRYGLSTVSNGIEYYQTPSVGRRGNSDTNYDFRLWTDVKETDYNWNVSATQPFNFLSDKSSVKAGYTGWYKKRSLVTSQVNTYTSVNTPLGTFNDPYEVILSPDKIGTGIGQAYYELYAMQNDEYDATSKYHAVYLMLDQRFFGKLRLVYGVRAENFNMKNRQEAYIKREAVDNPNGTSLELPVTGEKNWRFLPSVNLTYSLSEKMNIRAAFSKTMVRPDFRETAYFDMYDPFIDGFIQGWNVRSTGIQNLDLRYEWYPSAGEIVSVSAFYKKFNDPLELRRTSSQSRPSYRFENQDWAENIGVEMEVRKSLGFIADKKWLRNLTLYGNGSLMKSKVAAVSYDLLNGQLVVTPVPNEKRPLYGQSPWIVNAGINYDSKYAGFNVGYNRSGQRVYNIGQTAEWTEYENGRDLVDLQLSGKILKQKAELRLNISNVFDPESVYYVNPGASYTQTVNSTAYDKDQDAVQYRLKNGRAASLSLIYKL